jgi:hypothetical protein
MYTKLILNRRIILAVATPLARAILSAIVGYLSAKGVPADLVDQFSAVIGGGGLIAFNVGWELLDRKKAEQRGIKLAIEGLRLPTERAA